MKTTLTLVKAGPLLNPNSFSILFELEGPKADEIATRLKLTKGFKAKKATKLGAILISEGE